MVHLKKLKMLCKKLSTIGTTGGEIMRLINAVKFLLRIV